MVAFGFISGMLMLKYKPVYAVTIDNTQVGYVVSKDEIEKNIEENILSYNSKNVDTVELKKTPTYELKFVDRQEKTNEQDVLIAAQKQMEITYKYYQIALNNNIIETVDAYEDAQNIIDEIKQDEKNKDVDLKIIEQTTKSAEEVKTNSVEVAKTTISKAVNNETKTQDSVIGEVQGIKIAVKPISGIITSRYGVSSSIRRSTHTGLDIAASSGTPIKVIADGTVTFAKYSGSYGNLVKVSHGNGVETWYAHTSKMYVTVGQEVKAGDVIAAVGSTGNSTGAHLHLEIRINGNHVNPQNYIYNK